MQHCLNSHASSQTKGTQKTIDVAMYFLNYGSTHPDAIICYHARHMIFHIQRNALYLSNSQAQSCDGGQHFLGNKTNTRMNGPIPALAKMLCHVISSAAEAELAAIFHNAKRATPTRTALMELANHQPPTPIKTHNSIAVEIVNQHTKHKQSKAMDMRYY